jgi:hypothetical protein
MAKFTACAARAHQPRAQAQGARARRDRRRAEHRAVPRHHHERADLPPGHDRDDLHRHDPGARAVEQRAPAPARRAGAPEHHREDPPGRATSSARRGLPPAGLPPRGPASLTVPNRGSADAEGHPRLRHAHPVHAGHPAAVGDGGRRTTTRSTSRPTRHPLRRARRHHRRRARVRPGACRLPENLRGGDYSNPDCIFPEVTLGVLQELREMSDKAPPPREGHPRCQAARSRARPAAQVRAHRPRTSTSCR